jgi:hypothetical protein
MESAPFAGNEDVVKRSPGVLGNAERWTKWLEEGKFSRTVNLGSSATVLRLDHFGRFRNCGLPFV